MGEIADESIDSMQEKGSTYTEIDTGDFVARMLEMYEELDAAG